MHLGARRARHSIRDYSPPRLNASPPGGCVHGSWCGGSCTNGVDPIDDLDAACKVHDECLSSTDSSITQYASDWTCPPLDALDAGINCYCDGQLWEAANQVRYMLLRQEFLASSRMEGVQQSPLRFAHLSNGTCPLLPRAQAAGAEVCPWWNLFCDENSEVTGAMSIRAAMAYKLHCGSCTDGLPPNYVPQVPTDDDTTGSTGSDGTVPAGPTGSTASDTGSSCTAAVSYDVDLTYGDIEGITQPTSVASWDECCALCFDNADCFAW